MKFVLLLNAPLLPLFSSAQDLEIPKKEFALSFSQTAVELSNGESFKVGIRILKSKPYQKSSVQMGLSSALPQGIAIEFSPESGNFDSTEALITILPDAKPGQYALIINATLNYKTKGSILKITIP